MIVEGTTAWNRRSASFAVSGGRGRRPALGAVSAGGQPKALKVLRSRLYEMELQRQHDEIAEDRKNQVGTGEQSEKIRTYNFPQNRVTDHRIGFITHRLTEMLDGDLAELSGTLTTHYRSEALKDAEAVPGTA